MKPLLAVLLAAVAASAAWTELDLSVRADPDGFSSIKEEHLALDLTGTQTTARRWSFRGKAGGQNYELTATPVRRMDADELVQGWRFTAENLDGVLEPTSRWRADYRLTGSGPSVTFQSESSSNDAEFLVRSPEFQLRTRTAAGRSQLTGGGQDVDAKRAALLGASLILLKLDPPRRTARR